VQFAQLMNRAAGEALIRRYRQHEGLFPKTDAKDRHVAAAAVTARKQSAVNVVTVITWNLKDFNRKELAQAGLAVENPDTFLCRMMTLQTASFRLSCACATTFATQPRQRRNVRTPFLRRD
jgi:hypothetical protein